LNEFLSTITMECQQKMRTSRFPIVLLQYYPFSEEQMKWIENEFRKLSYSNVSWVSPALSVMRYLRSSTGIVLNVGYKYASFSFVMKGRELRTSYTRILESDGLKQSQPDLSNDEDYQPKHFEDKTTKDIEKWKLTTGWMNLKHDSIFNTESRTQVEEQYRNIVRWNWESEFLIAFKKAAEEVKEEVGNHIYENFMEKNVVLVGGGSFYVAEKWQKHFKSPFVSLNLRSEKIFAPILGAQQLSQEELENTKLIRPTRIDKIEDEGLYHHQTIPVVEFPEKKKKKLKFKSKRKCLVQ